MVMPRHDTNEAEMKGADSGGRWWAIKPFTVNPIQSQWFTTFQVRAWFQKDEPSSRLNRVPPIGAPKAAATPAAAPADTKSRLSLKCMKSTRQQCLHHLHCSQSMMFVLPQIIPVTAKVGKIKFDLLESDALELKDVKKKKGWCELTSQRETAHKCIFNYVQNKNNMILWYLK